MHDLLGLFNYWVFAALLVIGLYAVVSKGNFVKKLIGLSLFQSAVFLLYISMGKVDDGTAPILLEGTGAAYSHPLPQVLILTAIVVGISTLAVGLAITVRIREEFGTIEEHELTAIQAADARAEISTHHTDPFAAAASEPAAAGTSQQEEGGA